MGEFKQDMKHGFGKLLDSQGQVLYEGQYVDDKMEGKGKLILVGQFSYDGLMTRSNITGW